MRLIILCTNIANTNVVCSHSISSWHIPLHNCRYSHHRKNQGLTEEVKFILRAPWISRNVLAIYPKEIFQFGTMWCTSWATQLFLNPVFSVWLYSSDRFHICYNMFIFFLTSIIHQTESLMSTLKKINQCVTGGVKKKVKFKQAGVTEQQRRKRNWSLSTA